MFESKLVGRDVGVYFRTVGGRIFRSGAVSEFHDSEGF
jgi:hypothetical protein